MKTKNIQDVVAEKVEEYFKKWPSFEVEEDHGQYSEGIFIPDIEYAKESLTTTLTQLVKEVEAGERERIVKIVNDLKQQWGGAIDLQSAEFAESETKRRIIKNIQHGE